MPWFPRLCCCCWYPRVLGALLAVLTANLAGLCYFAHQEVTQAQAPAFPHPSYPPFPTDEQLASTSGSYFTGIPCPAAAQPLVVQCKPPAPHTTAPVSAGRPSDGGRIEYFKFGSDADSPTAVRWVVVHGSMNTGQMLTLFPGFDQAMANLSVSVIAPTMPGWGASDPYHPTFGITSQDWVQRWTLDTVALLDALGGGPCWVSGISLGGPPALALAEALARRGALLGVAPLVASMWGHDGFDLRASMGAVEGLVTHVLANEYAASAVGHYLLRPMILGTADWTRPVDTVGWDPDVWGQQMQRSVRYQLSGFVQSSHLVYQTGGTPLVDWSVFTPDIPVVVFRGDNDLQLPAPVTGFAASKLVWAREVVHAGGHFELDMVAVATELFGKHG
eukprot:gene6005-1072_t